MKLSSHRLTGGFVLLCTTLVVFAGSRSTKLIPSHTVLAAEGFFGQPNPDQAAKFDKGWAMLALIRGADPGNAQSTDWQLWSNKCFLAPGLRPAAGGDQGINLVGNCKLLRGPAQLAALQASVQNVNGIGSVYFNAQAMRSMLQSHVNLPPPGGVDPLTPAAGRAMNIAPFPAGSVVVKAIWELAPIQVSGRTNVAYLHYYNPTAVGPGVNDQLPAVTNWPWLQLLVDSPTCSQGPGVTTAFAPQSSVPLGCFITNPSSSRFSAAAIVNHVGINSCVSKCVLVLVGLHVAYKASSNPHDWSWTTFWWTNDPAADPSHFYRQTPNLPAVYTHFAMDTTYANPGAMYNPYQEGPEGPGATRSHCAGCHNQAATSLAAGGTATAIFPAISTAIAFNPPVCLAGQVCTDSIWSLASARNPDGGLFMLAGFASPGHALSSRAHSGRVMQSLSK